MDQIPDLLVLAMEVLMTDPPVENTALPSSLAGTATSSCLHLMAVRLRLSLHVRQVRGRLHFVLALQTL
jgi:hypothetical protein